VYLADYCVSLLTDGVASVRSLSYPLFAALITRLSSHTTPHLVTKRCEELANKLGLSPVWNLRQTFAFVAGHIYASKALSPKVFCKKLLPYLLALSKDKVPNVRLVVAEILTKHFVAHEYFNDATTSETRCVRQVYEVLRLDSDRDVRFFAGSEEEQSGTWEYSNEWDYSEVDYYKADPDRFNRDTCTPQRVFQYPLESNSDSLNTQATTDAQDSSDPPSDSSDPPSNSPVSSSNSPDSPNSSNNPPSDDSPAFTTVTTPVENSEDQDMFM